MQATMLAYINEKKTKNWVLLLKPIIVSELGVGPVHVSSGGFTI